MVVGDVGTTRETAANVASMRRVAMGMDDKISNAVEDATGKVKEATGKATDDEAQETEGKLDQVKSDLKQAGEKVKDAFDH